MEKYIVISKNTELLRIPASGLMYISAQGNYSEVVTRDGRKRLVSYQIGQLEDMIDEQMGEDEFGFCRLGRSLIVNMKYVYVIDISKQEVILSDCMGSYHTLSASRDILVYLKTHLENTNKDE